MLYPVLKACHLISMVAWFAGIFYLPRLFVYHVESKDELSRERFCVMERRLYYGIMWPAMIATIAFGHGMLIMIPRIFQLTWMHLKLFLIAILVGYHLYCGYLRMQFLLKKDNKSSRFYRIFNEVPTVLLILIIFLAVLKPFKY